MLVRDCIILIKYRDNVEYDISIPLKHEINRGRRLALLSGIV